MNKFPEGTILIEVIGIYDGWSVAKLPDGTLINRWDPIEQPKLYEATEKFLNGATDEIHKI